MTFNHAKYITDTVNGFCMQKTDFPFVSCIFDDASTDGEPEVIRKYVEEKFEIPMITEETDDYNLVLARHKSNANCYFIVLYLKHNHYSIKKDKNAYVKKWIDGADYLALCEGDDYWTDPLKLQKQVDFLEGNPEYSLTFHNAIEHWEDDSAEDRQFSNIEDKDYSGTDIFSHWVIPTASAVLRKDVYTSKKYIDLCKKNDTPIGDNLVWISASYLGKLRGMAFCASVYRRHTNSVTLDSGYFNHIIYQYKYWCFLDEPFKSIAADRFFEGFPQMVILCRKDRNQLKTFLKYGTEISPSRAFQSLISYCIKSLFCKKRNSD